MAKKYPGGVEVKKFPALSPEGEKYGILLTPTVMINEKVVAAGRVISEGELDRLIKKALEAK